MENCCGIQGKSPSTAYRFRPLCAAFCGLCPKPNKSGQSTQYGFFCGGFYGRIYENSKSGERVLTEKSSPQPLRRQPQRGPRREEHGMTNAPKTVLAIHDLPGFGRAALSVIAPVLSTLGCRLWHCPRRCCPPIPADWAHRPAGRPQLRPCRAGALPPAGCEIRLHLPGYLADSAQARLVEQAFELWPKALKVVDPVLGDGGRLYSGLGPTWSRLCTICAVRLI